MKLRIHISRNIAALLLLAASGHVPTLFGASPKSANSTNAELSSTNTEIPQSVFVLPSNPKEGRDPFFPDSTRLYENAKPVQAVNNSITLGDLVVRSIIVDDNGNLAIINNHTFATGDDGTVITKGGRQINVHCVAIDPKAKTVTVEAEGSKVVLHFLPDLTNP
jgi:hypothetical protein